MVWAKSGKKVYSLSLELNYTIQISTLLSLVTGLQSYLDNVSTKFKTKVHDAVKSLSPSSLMDDNDDDNHCLRSGNNSSSFQDSPPPLTPIIITKMKTIDDNKIDKQKKKKNNNFSSPQLRLPMIEF